MTTYAEQAGNSLIEAPDEVLLRQVHPAHVLEDGTVSKQAWLPNEERDQFLLSTRREEMGAAGAYTAWIEAGYASVGTWGASVAEALSCDTPAVDDASTVAEPFHASVDFQQLPSNGQRERRAKRLRDHAAARGCLHSPS